MCLEAVEYLADAASQPVGFTLQRVAHQQPRHSGITFGEGQQQRQELVAACLGGGFLDHDTTDAAEQAFLDELDETFQHLGFARKVPI